MMININIYLLFGFDVPTYIVNPQPVTHCYMLLAHIQNSCPQYSIPYAQYLWLHRNCMEERNISVYRQICHAKASYLGI